VFKDHAEKCKETAEAREELAVARAGLLKRINECQNFKTLLHSKYHPMNSPAKSGGGFTDRASTPGRVR